VNHAFKISCAAPAVTERNFASETTNQNELATSQRSRAASQKVAYIAFSGNNVFLSDRFGGNQAKSSEERRPAIFCTDIAAGAGNMFLGHRNKEFHHPHHVPESNFLKLCHRYSFFVQQKVIPGV